MRLVKSVYVRFASNRSVMIIMCWILLCVELIDVYGYCYGDM